MGYSGRSYFCYPGYIEAGELKEILGAMINTYIALKEYKEKNPIIKFIDFQVTPKKTYNSENKLFFSEEKIEKLLEGLDCFVKKRIWIKEFCF